MNPKDRKEHRRLRLIELIDAHFNKNQALFADHAQVAANLVSRYVTGAKGIGEDMRDKIERNTGFIGWLDGNWHSEPSALPAVPLTPRQQALLGLFDGLDDAEQGKVIRELEEAQRRALDAATRLTAEQLEALVREKRKRA